MTTPATTIRIRRATPTDVPAITLMLTAALETDPVARWLAPDIAERMHLLHRIIAVDVDHAIDGGHVDVTLNMTAVAVWHHHGTALDGPHLGTHHLTTFGGRAGTRLHHLHQTVDSYRPAQPHHWLSWLGVHPDHQQRGHAHALLHHHHTADTTGDPTHTIVTTTTARNLLQQHGYQPHIPQHLSGGPALWPLTRNTTTPPA